MSGTVNFDERRFEFHHIAWRRHFDAREKFMKKLFLQRIAVA
jgi:hypothetical protein